ncbi:hypothetical protein DFH09DRAFT_362016 [Mycena vulgaris]|nr:hypothetical protein DFH09DRAFT_362016 [Mycena vulgaris]
MRNRSPRSDSVPLLTIAMVQENDAQAGVLEDISSNGPDHVTTSTDCEKDLLQASDTDPEHVESAKEMNKPETRQKLDKDLAELTDTVFRIKQDFENVSHTLFRFDAQKLRKTKKDGSSGGDPIEPLQPKWRKFQDTFNQLLQTSQKTAQHGVYHAKRYRQVILQLAKDGSSDQSKEDTIIEIEGFIEDIMIGKLYDDGDRLKIGFDSLRSEISGFKTVMNMAISDASENVDQDMKEVEAKIKGVQAELAWHQCLATAGWIVMGGGAVCIPVVLGLAATTPVGWSLAACATLVVGGFVAGALGEYLKIRSNNQVDELNKTLDDPKEIQALKILFTEAEAEAEGQPPGQVTKICHSINTIAQIWSVFTLDAKTLKSALQGCTNSRTKAGLDRQIEMAQGVYAALEASLETYATKMAEVERGVGGRQRPV